MTIRNPLGHCSGPLSQHIVLRVKCKPHAQHEYQKWPTRVLKTSTVNHTKIRESRAPSLIASEFRWSPRAAAAEAYHLSSHPREQALRQKPGLICPAHGLSLPKGEPSAHDQQWQTVLRILQCVQQEPQETRSACTTNPIEQRSLHAVANSNMTTVFSRGAKFSRTVHCVVVTPTRLQITLHNCRAQCSLPGKDKHVSHDQRQERTETRQTPSLWVSQYTYMAPNDDHVYWQEWPTSLDSEIEWEIMVDSNPCGKQDPCSATLQHKPGSPLRRTPDADVIYKLPPGHSNNSIVHSLSFHPNANVPRTPDVT